MDLLQITRISRDLLIMGTEYSVGLMDGVEALQKLRITLARVKGLISDLEETNLAEEHLPE